MSEAPTFASSIATTASPITGADVSITDLSHLTKVVVKTTSARTGGLAPAFGKSEPSGAALICGTRPGEWMVIGEAADVAAACADVDGYTVDFTHGRALIEVRGKAATGVLEKMCSLDWSNAMMPDGAVISASVAKVSCDVIRRDHSGDRSYLLVVDRSFGQYLHDALADSATEFGHR